MDHNHHQQHHHHPVQEEDKSINRKGPHDHSHQTGTHIKGEEGDEKSTVHDKHAGHHTEDFLRRFWICLFLTIPVLLLSHMIQQWLGFHIAFKGAQYVLFALGAFIYGYGGWPFIKGMFSEMKERAIGMMTLVALAITVAFIYSAAVVFGLQGMDFFWELATLIDIMLLGHWIEMRSQSAASRALESLVGLLPAIVHVERNQEVTDIPLTALNNGELIRIKPGEKIPADGIVVEGSSPVNESMLTGESVPVKKGKDAKVIAGAVNGNGSLRVKVTGTGKDSYLNKVIKMVSSAQSAKSRTQHLADRVAKWLTIISISIGLGTFIFWLLKGNELSFALERMVTVMVTACPHALGVAIPLVVAISTTASATKGLLIRNRTAFEQSRKLTMIIFDKTGTLTEGAHAIQRVIPLGEFTVDEVLQYAASIQQHSEHYIAHGVMNEIKKRGLSAWNSEDFSYQLGIGVSGVVNGKKVNAAGKNFFKINNLPVPQNPPGINEEVETINYVLLEGKTIGIITLSDRIRATAFDAIRELKKQGIRSYLLTGDNEKIAAAVASQLEMDGYFANVLPHEKQEKVKEYQEKGEIVGMTGDGVNDAPALAQADVGIAIGSGTDVAAETADIILVNSDPMDVVNIIRFGRLTYRKMVQNLGWAAGYNIIAIPLAAGVMYPLFLLSPAIGAVLMSLSTIIVAFNAKLLRLN